MLSYYFRDIVVGHSLKAVEYASKRKIPLILNSDKVPFKFDTIGDNFRKRISLGKNYNREIELWSVLLYEHALGGLVPFGKGVSKINVENSEMKVFIRDSKCLTVNFSRCFVFEDDNTYLENEILSKEKDKYRVIDWFDVKQGASHSLELLEGEDDFVKTVIFYKSERIDGNHNKKDCVSVSYLHPEQLNDFDFSDTMARFKVQKMMKEAGILGTKRGSIDGEQKFSKIKLESRKREIHLVSKTKYRNTEKVIFMK